MFSTSEKRQLEDEYFIIIRKEERYIEVKSKNTGHCWMIFKKIYDPNLPVVLYHKHSSTDAWYHEHKKARTVKDAVKSIKLHDDYVVKHPNYLKMKRRSRKDASVQERTKNESV